MPSVAIEERRAEGLNDSSSTPDPSSTPADLSDDGDPGFDCRLLPLRCLAKPITLQSLLASRHELPVDIMGLVRRIEGITFFKEAFVPAAAREMILKKVPGGARWPDFCFQPSDATIPAPANGRSQGFGPWTEEIGGAGESQQVLAQRELYALATIVDDARECSTRFWGELAWKNLVHWPILSLAVQASGGRVVYEMMTGTSIETQWLPQRPPAVGSSASGGNTAGYRPLTGLLRERATGKHMADFAFALFLEDGGDDGRRPGDCALARAIDTAVAAQPKGWPLSINQTSHEPLARSPIGVSIKTGCMTDGGAFQLGIWTAAWHRRISELLALSPSSPSRPIVTLPLLLCCEHQWELCFAVDRGNEIRLIGPHPIGTTEDMLSIYRLLAVLRELCKWMEGPFRSWMMAAFGVGDAASPPEGEDSCSSQ